MKLCLTRIFSSKNFLLFIVQKLIRAQLSKMMTKSRHVQNKEFGFNLKSVQQNRYFIFLHFILIFFYYILPLFTSDLIFLCCHCKNDNIAKHHNSTARMDLRCLQKKRARAIVLKKFQFFSIIIVTKLKILVIIVGRDLAESMIWPRGQSDVLKSESINPQINMETTCYFT